MENAVVSEKSHVAASCLTQRLSMAVWTLTTHQGRINCPPDVYKE